MIIIDMKILYILFALMIPSVQCFSMGSNEVKSESVKKTVDVPRKKVLVHVLAPRYKGQNELFGKEIYQIILDEIINTDNFSLMINKPESVRNARIKFIEVHAEITQLTKSKDGYYSVGLFIADGNSGNVILQEIRKKILEKKVRFFVRKTMRSFFFSNQGEVKSRDPEMALMDDSNLQEESSEGKKKSSRSIKAGNVFSPLFEKRKKRINISGGDSSQGQSAKYAKDSYENMTPYTFRKKKPGDGSEDDEKILLDVPGNNIKRTSALGLNDSSKIEIVDNYDLGGSKNKYNVSFGAPTLLSREINKSLTEYAEDPEKVEEFSENKFSREKKELAAGSLQSDPYDGQIRQKGSFEKTTRVPGETIYSLGVNFMVDKVSSSDTIQTTNNFKQVGISLDMDKYLHGSRGGKISANFIYGFPVDIDKQFEVPGSMNLRVGYHKEFNDFFLGVASLEYERQFFVNVAKSGSALQAWQNTILWYNLGFDLNFEVFSRNLSFSAYFSKPFIGNTNYGGDEKRTMDGYRVYGKAEFQIYRNVSVKGEVFWSEMTSQGLSDLKNNHLKSVTYVIYSF